MTGILDVQDGAHPRREVEYTPINGKFVGKLYISQALDANMAKGTRVSMQDIAGNGLQNSGVLDKKNEEEKGVFFRGRETVDKVCLLSKADMLKLEEWNRVVPEQVNRCVHEVIVERCRAQPDAPAVCAWDGDFTYADLDARSSTLAAHLAVRGVGPEVFVPLCFDKSCWTVVAILGVLKAGVAFVLLDLSQPLSRLQELCASVDAKLVLSSVDNESRSQQLADSVVVLSSTLEFPSLCDLYDPGSTAIAMPQNAAYASFTSGSTGKPKAVVVEHSAYCSSVSGNSNELQLNCHSRVLQLASFAFTVSIIQMVTTLMVGGCICVPSETECRNDIAAAVRKLGVN